MPKKARRRRKKLGFSANVIKPPLFLADLKQGGGFFTGIDLILKILLSIAAVEIC